MTKLRASENVGAITIAGKTYQPDEDGSVDVEDRYAETMISHGYRQWNYGHSNPSIEAMTHSQMVLLVMERTKETLERMSVEDLRDRLLATNPATVILPDEAQGAGAAPKAELGSIGAEDIEAMNRPQLFAFLKASGVAVSPPIRNDELREYARMVVRDAESVDAAEAAKLDDQPAPSAAPLAGEADAAAV